MNGEYTTVQDSIFVAWSDEARGWVCCIEGRDGAAHIATCHCPLTCLYGLFHAANR